MLIYASAQDVPHVDGVDVDASIRAASALLRRETLTAVYDTDAEGYPADPELRDAFRDAVVAQVVYWAGLRVDPSLGAAGITSKGVASSKSIGSASVTYQVAETATTDRVAALATLAPAARDILDGVFTDRTIRVIG